MSSITEQYHKQWLGQKSDAQKERDNARAFDTYSRLFKDVIGKSFEGKMVDLGCGDGSFYSYCQTRGLEAEGLDILDGVNFETDVLPLTDNAFDIVLLQSVLEHLYNPSILIQQVKRVLKPGGVVVMVIPNIDQCGSSFYDDHTHVKPYNPAGLKRLMGSFEMSCAFCGLWTAGKSSGFWKLPEKWQYRIGRYLPFTGRNKWAPSFLKGRSVTMLSVFAKR